MSAIQVRAAGQPDEQAVIDVLTLAFSTDPMARWAYPAPETFLGVWPLMVRAFGGAGFAFPVSLERELELALLAHAWITEDMCNSHGMLPSKKMRLFSKMHVI